MIQITADHRERASGVPAALEADADVRLDWGMLPVGDYILDGRVTVERKTTNEVAPNIRVVRGAFIEGEPLWDGSELREETHIQIAVRDTAVIENLVRVEEPENEQF